MQKGLKENPTRSLIFISILIGVAFVANLLMVAYIGPMSPFTENDMYKQYVSFSFLFLGILCFLSFALQHYEGGFASSSALLPMAMYFFSVMRYSWFMYAIFILFWLLVFIPGGLYYAKKKNVRIEYFYPIQLTLLVSVYASFVIFQAFDRI